MSGCWALQGVDWRDPRAQGCNAGRNPIQESFYDGVNADPLEVLFVKVKASMHQAHWQHVLQVTHFPPSSDLPGRSEPENCQGSVSLQLGKGTIQLLAIHTKWTDNSLYIIDTCFVGCQVR